MSVRACVRAEEPELRMSWDQTQDRMKTCGGGGVQKKRISDPIQERENESQRVSKTEQKAREQTAKKIKTV